MAMQKFQEIATGIASGTALIGGSGNLVVITNPTITVKDAGTNNISTIFSDEGITALANPFEGDSSGRFAFYASDGDYDVTVSKSGFNSYTIPDIQLFVSQTGLLNNFTAVVAPTVNDDISLNYVVGSSWVDTVADKSYICVDNTAGNAVWEQTNGNIKSDGSVPFTGDLSQDSATDTTSGITGSIHTDGGLGVAKKGFFGDVVSGVTPTADAHLATKGYVDAHGLVQAVHIQDGVYATSTTTIPSDNTIPQITEGTEFMTLGITPTNANNILEVDVVAYISSNTSVTILIGALFQDSTANALATGAWTMPSINFLGFLTFKYRMVAGTTSATTFRLRMGPHAAATLYFNGTSAARFSGTFASTMNIKEIKA